MVNVKTIEKSLYFAIAFIISFLVGTLLFVNSSTNTGKKEVITVEKTSDGRVSYNYLKSVTVVIEGAGLVEMEIGDIDLGKMVKQWLGTGIIIKIDDNFTYILTNAHVTGKGIEGVVLFVQNEERKVPAEVVTVHSVLDMAVIKVPGKLTGKRVINGISSAEIQDKVYMVGHSLGDKYIYSEGCMAGYYEAFNLYQLPTMPGNSGSGIFNKDGNLVGLIFAGRVISEFFGVPIQQDVEYGIGIDSLNIKMFLEKEGLI